MASVASAQKYRQLVGVVVNAGERLKTIRVRVAGQKWNDRIKKNYSSPSHILVNDPVRSTRLGDVIRFRPGWRVSKHIRHVVTEVVTPFGTPLSERPPVPTEEEREAQRAEKRLEKDKRQAARGRTPAVKRLKEADEEGKKAKEAIQIRAVFASRSVVVDLLQKEFAANLPEGHWARNPEEVMIPAADVSDLSQLMPIGPLIRMALVNITIRKNHLAIDKRPQAFRAKLDIQQAKKLVLAEKYAAEFMARDADEADKKLVLKLLDNVVTTTMKEIESRSEEANNSKLANSAMGAPSTQIQEVGAPGPDIVAEKVAP